MQEWLDQLVESPGHLNAQSLRDRNWLAVPVESGSHFAEDDANNLAHAMQLANCRYCYGIAIEPLDAFPHAWRIEATKDGLLEFSKTCAHFNFVLVPDSMTFAILCTVYDYYIVAGPSEFVQTAVGGDIAHARLQFIAYIDSNHECDRLRNIAERYVLPQ